MDPLLRRALNDSESLTLDDLAGIGHKLVTLIAERAENFDDGCEIMCTVLEGLKTVAEKLEPGAPITLH
jgi:hypothetical protein